MLLLSAVCGALMRIRLTDSPFRRSCGVCFCTPAGIGMMGWRVTELAVNREVSKAIL